ncbi:hypothetical protein ACTFIV_009476 [Dictyostelium citrinum]
MKLLAILISLLLVFSTIVQCEEAYFAFKVHNDKDFIFKLTDDTKIKAARDILSGKETDTVHVLGRIRKIRQSYNPDYNFHLDPATISFFQMAIEVCDATPQYVEDHLDEACGAFLPGCFYCPWASKLSKEIKPSELLN